MKCTSLGAIVSVAASLQCARAAIRLAGILAIVSISCIPAARATEVWTFDNVVFNDSVAVVGSSVGTPPSDSGTITGSFTTDASDNILSFDFTESGLPLSGFNVPAVTYNSSAGDTVQLSGSDEYTFSTGVVVGDLSLFFVSPLPLDGGTDQFATTQFYFSDASEGETIIRAGLGEVTTPVSSVPDTGSTALLLSIAVGIMLLLHAIASSRCERAGVKIADLANRSL